MPPYSRGHATADQPPAKRVRSHSLWASNPSAVSREGRSPGTFSVSQLRARSRNSISSGVRSTPISISGCLLELRLALFDKGVPRLTRVGVGVELKGEALLVAVTTHHVEQLDSIKRFLGQPHRTRALAGDLLGELPAGGAGLVTASLNQLSDSAKSICLLGTNRLAREEHPPGRLLAEEPHRMRRRAKRSTVDLGQTEA